MNVVKSEFLVGFTRSPFRVFPRSVSSCLSFLLPHSFFLFPGAEYYTDSVDDKFWAWKEAQVRAAHWKFLLKYDDSHEKALRRRQGNVA